MRIKRALPILWLPLIGFWTFLFAIQLNTPSTELEGVVPLISYLLVSFLLVLQLQLVIGNKREGALVKFGTANVLLSCLLVSSISVFLNLIQAAENELSIALIVIPLIINTIIAEVFSVSNKQISKKRDDWINSNKEIEESQSKSLEDISKERNISLKTREDWKRYLHQASIDHLGNSEILDELTRIKDIVPFSSYFRTEESSATLKMLERGVDESQLLLLLRTIK